MAADMVARRRSGKAEAANGEFVGHGEVTSTLTRLKRTRLQYWVIELGPGTCVATAVVARWRTTQRHDGRLTILAPNWPS